ncbi:MAG TPA: hypothetical protein DGG94_08045 [Micromonosporaceae bacterium]|nr:hypothetical protein [Micromonosporaceae bacterium]HCU49737.1 hypothetical protein [Micromonosporaceae bacterium]
MAKILHVDDESFWRDIVSKALSHDHLVHSTGSYEGALELIRSVRDEPYDLALVDLNLVDDHDYLGGEILDHLRESHPNVRRIVVTGSPPSGPLRARLLDRYDVDEIIIKSQHGPPELRGTVERILRGMRPQDEQPGTSPRMRLARERFTDWVPFRGHIIRDLLRTRREAVVALTPSDSAWRMAQKALAVAKGIEARFESERERLERLLTTMAVDDDAAATITELDRVEAELASLVRKAEQDITAG